MQLKRLCARARTALRQIHGTRRLSETLQAEGQSGERTRPDRCECLPPIVDHSRRRDEESWLEAPRLGPTETGRVAVTPPHQPRGRREPTTLERLLSPFALVREHGRPSEASLDGDANEMVVASHKPAPRGGRSLDAGWAGEQKFRLQNPAPARD